MKLFRRTEELNEEDLDFLLKRSEVVVAFIRFVTCMKAIGEIIKIIVPQRVIVRICEMLEREE